MTPLKPGERSCIGWGPPSTPKRNSVVCAPPKGSALDIAPELLGDDNVDNLVTLLQVCGPMWLAASQRLIDVKSPQDTVTELVRLATRQSWLGEVYDLGQAALRQPAEYRLTSPEQGRRVFDAFLQLASRRAKSLATASLLPPWNLVGILSPGPTVAQRTLKKANRQWEALTTAEQCHKNGTRTSGWTDLPCTTHPVSRLMYQLLHEGQFESDNAFFVEAVDLIQRIATGLLDTKLVENGHQKAKTDKRKGVQKTHCTLEHLQRVLMHSGLLSERRCNEVKIEPAELVFCTRRGVDLRSRNNDRMDSRTFKLPEKYLGILSPQARFSSPTPESLWRHTTA